MITKKTIEKIADVSRLSLTEQEKSIFLKDLNDVLDAFSVIKQAEVHHDILVNPNNDFSILREDKVVKTKLDLRKSSKLEDGYFVGPKLK